LGYGKGAKVITPPELIDLVKAEIAGMMPSYNL
jgi:predicted DNA-binding transcriptional regulator YafY